MSKITKKEIELAGRTLSLETGRLAGHANGAVLARYGDTVLLAAATEDAPREGIDYFPLRVDFEERLYAGGIIKGSRWVKREGRPSDEAILAGRLIDRSVRPLFPEGYFRDVQVIILPLSVDQENDAELLSVVAASAALSISDIPWDGPIGAIRVGYLPKEDRLLLNPTNGQLEESVLDLVVSGTKERTVMIEAGAKEVPEEKLLEAIQFGQDNLQRVIGLISKFQSEIGKEKLAIEVSEADDKNLAVVKENITAYVLEKFVPQILEAGTFSYDEQDARKKVLYEEFEGKISKSEMGKIFDRVVKKAVRNAILESDQRLDGRALDEVRPLDIDVGLLPRTHGSGLFQRGETQILTVATLGSASLEQMIEGMTGEWKKRYMHHYNFPPFSVGETRPLRGPGRREIGHGSLAEKALRPVIPSKESFPYTLRLVSEALSSAGSTSMAATCGSTLALMDAGVPISAPVAGIAIGLIEGEDGSYKILTDIAALEDSNGDMDFKITGTRAGVTAIQLDVKNKGLTLEMVREAVESSLKARLHILDEMEKVIQTPRAELSKYAPKITQLKIDPKKIGSIIGPGGKIIKTIIEETGVGMDVEDDGTVFISSADDTAAAKAKKWVEGLVAEAEIGKTYEGEVVRVENFGAFVKILPNKDGLVHVSELSHSYVENAHQEVKLGDKVKVKVLGIDERGRINLSIKALTEQTPSQPRNHPSSRGPARGPHRPSYRTPSYRQPNYQRSK